MRPAERGAGGRSDRTVVRILGNGYSVNNLWPDVLVDQEPHTGGLSGIAAAACSISV
jgi:hypothetical protein